MRPLRRDGPCEEEFAPVRVRGGGVLLTGRREIPSDEEVISAEFRGGSLGGAEQRVSRGRRGVPRRRGAGGQRGTPPSLLHDVTRGSKLEVGPGRASYLRRRGRGGDGIPSEKVRCLGFSSNDYSRGRSTGPLGRAGVRDEGTRTGYRGRGDPEPGSVEWWARSPAPRVPGRGPPAQIALQ